MLQKTRGIVLHKTRYAESNVIVKFYTEKLGLVSLILYGLGKSKSKTKGSLLQPLSIVDLELDHKEKKDLHHLKEMRSGYLFKSIPFNILKSSILLFLNEILYKCIKEEEANEQLFQFIHEALISLDEKESGFQNFHLNFLIRLSGYLGFNPMNNYQAGARKYFHLEEGEFSGSSGSPDEVMGEEESRTLHRFLTEKHEAIDINNIQRNSLLNYLLKYYSHHIPRFPEIKSHLVLKEVLS